MWSAIFAFWWAIGITILLGVLNDFHLYGKPSGIIDVYNSFIKKIDKLLKR